MRSRLFLQIYFGFLAIALVFSVATFAFHALGFAERVPPPIVTALANRFAEALPEPTAPDAELQQRMEALGREYGVDATLWSSTGERLASVGDPLRGPRWRVTGSGTIRMGRRGVSLTLPDGRRLGIRPHFGRGRGRGPIAGLLLLNLAIAAVAWPVSRRMARRLERLRTAVDELGAGDLSARVPVEGRDEIADLAHSFNQAAGRIEGLVVAQQRVLASASHELRSPLTRLRMALELFSRENDSELIASAERDIQELDELIGDVLTAARLEAGRDPRAGEPVALLDLVSEEATHVDAEVSGEAVTVDGDPRLLRRLVRNLLENARRHAGEAVEIRVETLPAPGSARISVSDRGPGIPAAERARIFEPFYRPPSHSEGRDGSVGLGLALVREIAEHHGGEARCLPRQGGGTVFEVDLHCVPEPSAGP